MASFWLWQLIELLEGQTHPPANTNKKSSTFRPGTTPPEEQLDNTTVGLASSLTHGGGRPPIHSGISQMRTNAAESKLTVTISGGLG